MPEELRENLILILRFCLMNTAVITGGFIVPVCFLLG